MVISNSKVASSMSPTRTWRPMARIHFPPMLPSRCKKRFPRVSSSLGQCTRKSKGACPEGIARPFGGAHPCVSAISDDALRRQRLGHGLDVVAEHVEIGSGRSVRWRQRVGKQRAADLGAGLLRDLVEQPAIGD